MPFDPSPGPFFDSVFNLDENNRITFQLEGGFGPPDGLTFGTTATDTIHLSPSSSSWNEYASFLTVGNKIKLSATGSVPAGLANDTEYWIVDSVIDSPVINYVDIKISATEGGAAISGFSSSVPLYGSLMSAKIPAGSTEALPKILASQADLSTGDWRVVAFALLELIVNKFNGIITANKPTRFTCSKKTTGSDNVMVRSYTFSMNLTPPDEAAETVLDE